MPKLLNASIVLALALVALTATANARGSSVITGVITEAAHSHPMMSVSVTAFAANGAWAGSSRTGKDGVFRLNGLEAGGYRLLVTKPGYRPVEVSGLTVAENDHLVVGFPIALQAAPFDDSDPVQLVARCNSLVNPDEVADVYVICGN